MAGLYPRGIGASKPLAVQPRPQRRFSRLAPDGKTDHEQEGSALARAPFPPQHANTRTATIQGARCLTRCLPVLLILGLAAGCADRDAGEGGRGRQAPTVVVARVVAAPLVDSIEAVGTAHANEQADINSTVTERIARINFTDGQHVAKGAIIAQLVQREQDAALAENRARLREAELQLERLKTLQQQGFATRSRVDAQQASVDIARAGAQAAGSQIADRVIRAPFAGWLSLREVSPGAVVNAGTTIVTITDYSRIKLDFTVPEQFVPVLRPGLAIEATASAFPGETFHGSISSINPALDPVTRSATARAILPNPDLRLRPGMLMTVAIKSQPRTALTVPEAAIIGEGGNAFVWKVSADNDAQRVNVGIGLRQNGRVEIVSGLKAGDRVVGDGTVKLRAAGPVKPVAASADASTDAAADATAAGATAGARP